MRTSFKVLVGDRLLGQGTSAVMPMPGELFSHEGVLLKCQDVYERQLHRVGHIGPWYIVQAEPVGGSVQWPT